MEDLFGKSSLQLKLENCLLTPARRRWAMHEFFYSAIDRPFFLDNKFLSGLRDLGIPPATKLTTIELNYIRLVLGGGKRPRRFSLAFLQEVMFRHGPGIVQEVWLLSYVFFVQRSLCLLSGQYNVLVRQCLMSRSHVSAEQLRNLCIILQGLCILEHDEGAEFVFFTMF